MGAQVSRNDFEWANDEDFHANRRKQILAKYPQITKLYGPDPMMKYQVVFLVIFHYVTMYFIKDVSWTNLLILAYWFGGVISHVMMTAIHEMCHNAAYGHSRPMANRILSMIANLPVGFPGAITFRAYHLDHHRYLGYDTLDVDLPTEFEGKLFCTTFGKFVWLILQPFFYMIRPLLVNPKRPTLLEAINTVVQLTYDFLVYYYLGGKMLAYMIIGSLMVMGPHPLAGHALSDHFMFTKGIETYSYYGWLNIFNFNAGYHNEHHDFPAVPGCRLPQVTKIAPEFYNCLPQHGSWLSIMYTFVMDPDIGPYARVKRKPRKQASKNAFDIRKCEPKS